MKELLWKAAAWVLSRKPVADYLIERAQRTPYFHLGPDGAYMGRWHLFNAPVDGVKPFPRLPWIRVPHIRRADVERHPHNHPCDARTIILRGWYYEVRGGAWPIHPRKWFNREYGSTATIPSTCYHRIVAVPPEGVWTLFLFFRKTQSWGFHTERGHVNWREYLDVPEGEG